MLNFISLIIIVFIGLHIYQYADESHLQFVYCHGRALQSNAKPAGIFYH